MTAPDKNGWLPIETAPKDGTVVNVVARTLGFEAGFPRYAAYRDDLGGWVEYSRHEPERVVPWAWRPRGDWPAEDWTQ